MPKFTADETMNITIDDNGYTEEMVDEMVRIYIGGQVNQRWDRARMKKDEDLYRNVQTWELRLGNHDSETEGGIPKPTGTDNKQWKCNEFWKESWIGEVRVLYSYRRSKIVFRGDMKEAGRMMNILERVAHQEEREKGKWEINIPDGYAEKTKEKRTKSRRPRKSQAEDSSTRWKC